MQNIYGWSSVDNTVKQQKTFAVHIVKQRFSRNLGELVFFENL